jgi:hypothetical protein
MDPELKVLLQVLIEGQTRTDKSVGELANVVAAQVERSESRAAVLDAAHKRTEEAIANLAVTVDKYVLAADARMKRIEENLDGLIRAISREHSNGKGHA